MVQVMFYGILFSKANLNMDKNFNQTLIGCVLVEIFFQSY